MVLLMYSKAPCSAREYETSLNCNSIHTFFMKENIDICITDKDNNIIYLKENLSKNKVILPIKKGKYVYEFPINTISKYNLKLNNKIKVTE